jgi:hypothetical protein
VIYFLFCLLFGLLFFILTLLVVFSPLSPPSSPISRSGSISKQINQEDEAEAAPLLPATYPRNHQVYNEITSNPMYSSPASRLQAATVSGRDGLTHPMIKQSPKKWIVIIIGFVLFYPLMFFACISLPTWWNRFNRYYIQKYQQSEPSKSYGSYWTITIDEDVYLKIFPDIVMYYGSIYFIAILALLTQAYPPLQRFFFYRPRSFGWMSISIGELLLSVLIAALVIAQFCYFYYDHGWDLSKASTRTAAERTARALGQVANLGKFFSTSYCTYHHVDEWERQSDRLDEGVAAELDGSDDYVLNLFVLWGVLRLNLILLCLLWTDLSTASNLSYEDLC